MRVAALLLLPGATAFFLGGAVVSRNARISSSSRSSLRMESIFNSEFENKEGVDIDESGALKKIILRTVAGDTAEIYTLGACVTSFKCDGYDSLFVRPDAKLDGSKPISGGLPFCFPQFGPGKIQQHGFARNLEWSIESTRPGASPSVTLKLLDTPETLAMWPHKFQALYSVTLSSGVLSTTLKIKNTGDTSFEFQTALHSYFRVGDIDDISIKSGALLFADYLDKTANPPVNNKWSAGDITISKPVDSVFSGVSGEIVLEDTNMRKKLRIKNTAGYEDTIIWSPYGDDNMGYKNFVCIESGKVTTPYKLDAGKEWIGKMDLVPGSL